MSASLGKLLNLLAAATFVVLLCGNTEGGCEPTRDLDGDSPDDECFMEADRCFGDDGHGEECEGIEMFCIELEDELGRCLEESPRTRGL